MFLKSKYIFETQNTRFNRYFFNILLFVFFLFLFYTISCFIFINVSREEGLSSESKLFHRRPDLIVVFTGDKGRIPLAVKIAKKYDQYRIFITGVFSSNSVKTLIDPIDKDNGIDRKFLEIDYFARNTFENSLATYRYIQNNKGIQKILIVSHDYHIMRIKKIMKEIQSPYDKYEFYYMGVKTNYHSFRNIKLLYKEVFKLVRTYLFLLMWDKGTETFFPSK